MTVGSNRWLFFSILILIECVLYSVHHAKMILRCPKTGNRDVSYFNLDSKESVSNFDPDQVKISFLFVLTNGAKMSSEWQKVLLCTVHCTVYSQWKRVAAWWGHRVSIYIERPSVVNFINSGGGDPLCTLQRAEGLYGWVRCRGYMRDSLLKT